ncbi:hemolysin family protein [Salinifilum ghardaiensis]
MGSILLAVVLLGGNAFFVGAEFALISARRSQIEPRLASGGRMARVTLHAMERVSLMMAAAQLGITACSLGLGAVAEPVVAHWLEAPFTAAGLPDWLLHPTAFVLALAVVTYFHMVFGEMVPKNLALAAPERAALLLGPPLYGLVRVVKPAVVVLNALANGLVRLLRVTPREEVSASYSRDDMAALIDESHQHGMLPSAEHELLERALQFPQHTVGSVLLPLRELVTLPAAASPQTVQATATRTGFSRFPITDASGELTGYVHLRDVLSAARTTPQPGEPPLAGALRALPTVPAHTPLHEALHTMRRQGTHLARVTDTHGTVLGVVALEDVLEELVGEIRDTAHRRSA